TPRRPLHGVIAGASSGAGRHESIPGQPRPAADRARGASSATPPRLLAEVPGARYDAGRRCTLRGGPVMRYLMVLSAALVLTPAAPAGAAAPGGTFYVRPDGSDANPGLADAPSGAWRTLQKAADAARAGDTVVVRPGTYAGMNRYGKPGGTAAAPVRFLADPG